MKLHVAHVGLCLCIVAGGASIAQAATLNVDDDNQTGSEDGSAAHPYSTVQKAVDKAASAGDTIQIAAGVYAGGTKVERKEVKLLGGFAGGTSNGYAGGTPGDFGARAPTANVTRLTGTATVPALELKYTKNSVVDGLVMSDGLIGVATFGEVAAESNPTISNNLIENNGFKNAAGDFPTGAGIFAQKGGAIITGNVVRNNTGLRGAGLASFCDKLVATGNVIDHNIGHGDHAGGVYLTGVSITFSHNVVSSNECCKTTGYGWGGGGLVFQNPNLPVGTTKALLSYNVWTDNKAGSSGSAIFVDDKAQATFDHELVYRNRCSSHGEVIYVDGYDTGSIARFVNSTVVDNPCPPTANGHAGGVFIERNSSVTIENSIFWNNGGKDFAFDNTANSLVVKYSIMEEAQAGPGNLKADPLFADAAAGDYHLRSTVGRYDRGNWVTDSASSPAIDAADPAAPFNLEPGPNGGRANMGHYGNTCEASLGGAGGGSTPGDCVDAPPPPPPPFSDAGPPPVRIDGGSVIADDGGVINPNQGIGGGCGCRAASRGHGMTSATLLWLLAGAGLAGRRFRRRHDHHHHHDHH